MTSGEKIAGTIKRNFVLQSVLVSGSVFLAVKAGLWMAPPPYYSPPIWPAFGLAVVYLLILGFRQSFAVIVGMFLGFYFHNYHAAELIYPLRNIVIILSLTGLLVVATKALLIKWLIKEIQFIREPASLLKLTIILLVYSVILFLLGLIMTTSTQLGAGNVRKMIAFAWTGADLLGSLVIIPCILSFSKEYSKSSRAGNKREAILTAIIFVFISSLVAIFQGLDAINIFYLGVPFIFWIAFRFNIRDTSISLLVMVLLFILVWEGENISDVNGFFKTLYYFQIFLMVLTIFLFLINSYTKNLKTTGSFYLPLKSILKPDGNTGKKNLLYHSDILRLAVEHSPASTIVTDRDGTILFMNPAFTKITGYEMHEVIGKTPNILKSGYHSRTFYDDMWETINAGKIWEGEFYNRKKDGTFYWEKAIIAPVFNKSEISHFVCTKEDITELVANREAIKVSEKKYRLLAENVADIIWVINEQLNITFVSPSIAKVTGYRFDELDIKNIRKHLPVIPREYLSMLNNLRKGKLRRDAMPFNKKWESQFQRKDGSVIWLESRLSPVFLSASDHFDGIIGVSRDITANKNSEEALRKSEERFRTFFDNTSAIILMIDPETGKIVKANNAALDFYGYQQCDFFGMAFSEITDDSDPNILDSLLDKGKHVMQHRTKNGRIKDVEVNPTIVVTDEKDILFTIIQDITRRKKAIAALKESESKKLALLKIIPDIIIVINENEIIIDVYIDKASRLYVPPYKMLGKKLTNFVPPEMKAKFREAFRQALWRNEIITFDYSYLKGNELIFEEARFIVSGHNELLIILRDISELKRSELELKRAWEEAERANMAKSTFLASMSHEIRTPINAIMGFNELLSRELDDKHLSSYLMSIKSSSKALLSLIDDILDLSKIEAGELNLKPAVTDLKSMLSEVKKVFDLKMKQKDLAFSVTADKRLPSLVIIDEMRLRQILLNLIGNAYKFTDKGKIEVSCYPTGRHIRNDTEYINLILEISDTGIGVPDEYQETIFEAFKQQDQQDSRKYGGTGLGLAITKRLVEMMHGTITLRSKINKGSTFIISIPGIQVTPKSNLPENITSKREQVIFTDSSVLIVDDVATNRELLKGLLKGENLKIYEATDGLEAMKIASEKIPDIILLDIKMPKANGYEVAEYVKKHRKLKETPVIAISATNIAGSEMEKAKKYFDLFLIKPINIIRLINELKKHIPYKTLGENRTVKKEMDLSCSHLNLDKKKKLARQLEKLFLEHNAITDSSSFEEIGKFARDLKILSVNFKINGLVQYANEIIASSENFDIEEITEHFAMLPKLIKQIDEEIRN